MANLHEDSVWVVVPEAAALHQRGLDKAVEAGDYAGAHTDFDSSLDILAHVEQSADVELQTARIIRDDGFTHVREVLRTDHDLWSLDTYRAASVKLHSSLNVTADLLEQDYENPKRLKELMSEHGATLGCLGRMVVAMQVKDSKLPFRPDKGVTQEKLREEQHYFGKRESHKYL